MLSTKWQQHNFNDYGNDKAKCSGMNYDELRVILLPNTCDEKGFISGGLCYLKQSRNLIQKAWVNRS